jgi:hypothetical protein
MDASERRAFRRRVLAGLLGVITWAVLLFVVLIWQHGLSWRSVGTAAIILGVCAAAIPVAMTLTEEIRRSMRHPDE